MQQGLYEQLVNSILASKIGQLDRESYYVRENKINETEASDVLSQYLLEIVKFALNSISGEESVGRKVDLVNNIIELIRDELNDREFNENIIDKRAIILSAIFSKVNAGISDFDQHLKEITPYTRLSQSELFTGSNAGISLESEIKKEILSSDRIYLLVSFIKWSGIRIFERQLKEFTDRGGQLRIITTTYMGATDLKAVEFLSNLKNAELKVSYNAKNERLHAKAYLFLRNTGFHTGYIGSSNISRSALTNGLEWNLKVTTKEISHIIGKFEQTFETYWQDKEFEHFDKLVDLEKLGTALKKVANKMVLLLMYSSTSNHMNFRQRYWKICALKDVFTIATET